MARRPFADFIGDDAGNAVGSRKIRIYEIGTEVLATLYLHSSGAETLAQPFTVNEGKDTKIRVQPGVADTALEVDSTTGFVRGDVLLVRSGATTKERTIKTVTDADTFELVETIGFAFPVGSAVGSEGMLGHFKVYLDDAKDYEYTVENIATGEISPRKPIYTLQLASTIDVQEEGALAGTRGKVNFKGPNVKAADDGANNRVNVDVDKQEDLGTVSSATPTWDWALAPNKKLTLGVSITALTLSNPEEGGWYHLHIAQDATGGRTITWPASVKWPGGTAPTLSGANKVDKITLHYVGASYYGSAQTNY